MRNCTLNQNLACFVHNLKIIGTENCLSEKLKNDIHKKKKKTNNNILHITVLINTPRTTWPTETLIPLLIFSDNCFRSFQDAFLYYFINVDNLRQSTKNAKFWPPSIVGPGGGGTRLWLGRGVCRPDLGT